MSELDTAPETAATEEVPASVTETPVEAPVASDNAGIAVEPDAPAIPAEDAPAADAVVTSPQFRNAAGQFAAAPATDTPAEPASEPEAPAPAAEPESAPESAAAEPAPEAAPDVSTMTNPAPEAPAVVSPVAVPLSSADSLAVPLAHDAGVTAPAAPAPAPLSETEAALQQRLEEAVAKGEHLAEQLALHVAAAAEPVMATLESVAPGPVHLAEEEIEKIGAKLLDILHIHFGTKPAAQ